MNDLYFYSFKKSIITAFLRRIRMPALERLKTIGFVTKNLINGYIRESEIKLFGDVVDQNPYYHISPLIINYCILFFPEIFTWYKKKHGDGMEFISDIEVKQIANGWSICMFENEISNKICDKFSMTFKCISFGDERDEPNFCIGWAKGDSLEASIADWNGVPGPGMNRYYSDAYAFWGQGLHRCGGSREFEKVKGVRLKYSCSDLFKISFDFIQNKVEIYHNDEVKDWTFVFKTKVWVGLAMRDKGCQIKMMEYKYD